MDKIMNGILDDLRQSMMIGKITIGSETSEKILDYIDSKDKEIERLNNIIDELEKWVKEDNCCFEIQFVMGRCVNYQCILDKLEELKGSDKDEK